MSEKKRAAAAFEAADGSGTVTDRERAQNISAPSLTQARSRAAWELELFRLAERLHRLGPRAVGELLLEINALVGDHVIERLHEFAALRNVGEFIDLVSGEWRNAPPEIVPMHVMRTPK